MTYYKVTQVIQYTESYWVQADDELDALFEACSSVGVSNQDNEWIGDTVEEISKEEYEERAGGRE